LLKQATTRCHIFVRAGKRSALSEADFSRKTRALGSRTNTWIAQSISIHPYPMAKEGWKPHCNTSSCICLLHSPQI